MTFAAGCFVSEIATDRRPVLDCGGPSYLLPPNWMQDEIGPQLTKIARKIRESMGIPPGSQI
jgi:hypothetical protein